MPLEWQALHPDPSSAGAHGIACHWAPSRAQVGEKRGKKKEKTKIKIKNCCQLKPIYSQRSGFKLWQDIPRKPFPIEHPGLGEGGGDKEQQVGAQVTEPVQALPWL